MLHFSISIRSQVMPAQPPDCRLLRFGLFEADLAAGELRKNGLRVKLQDRPFEILAILLERPGEVITREEFRQRLWSADTFVDFDHSLNASINKLRQALNDVPDNPRFVATVGRRGYRFLAPVSYPTAHLPTSNAPGQVLAPPVAEAPALPDAKRRVRTWVLSSCIALMALAAVFSIWISRRSHPPLKESDSILLADFLNSTGDPAFDSAFREAIAIELGQSPFLNIVSNDRVRQTLREMSRPPDDSVQQLFAREVCERVGARAYLSGSLARLGAGYVLAIKAVNCADDTTVAHEQAEVSNRDALLPAVDDVAAKMRRRLGESLNSIRRFDVPVEEATTQSLEALKAYSLGQAQRARGAEKDSLPFYDHALDLDPNFAMAYAARAGAYQNLGETERAAVEVRKAYALRANLSEREKLILTVRYANADKADTQRVIDTYKVWHQLYPRDARPLNGLSARYQVIGNYEKAAEAARAALDLQRDNYMPYANLARSYEALGRFEDAKQVCATALAAQRDSSDTHDVSLDIAFLQNDQATRDREIVSARGTNREEGGYWNEGLILASAGKLTLARPLFERSYAKRRQDKLDDFAAYAMAVEALIEADFGFEERARKQARQAITLGHGIDTEITVAEILSLTGADAEASDLAEDLHKRFPLHIPLNPATIPMILANVQIHKGNSVNAVQLLQQAIPYDFAEFTDLAPIYVRGQAYLRMGSGPEAASEFQKILDHPGINVLFPRHPLAVLGLARSYALMHETAKARKAYQDFFAKWSEADGDLPILLRARAEYAKL